jgi:methionyl-tRNA formyltransferase
MTPSDLRIVFMGTPDFATHILSGLLDAKMNVVGVITAPDKPAGRGQKMAESSVKKFSIEHELTILQPTNLKDENFVKSLKDLSADLFIVVAFRMLPEIVWNMPPKGTVNLHASLLPNYRGAAPINWAIINGEITTGVTTFFIEQEIDTGMVIERTETEIDPNESAGELHDRLMKIGSQLINSSVEKISNGSVTRTPQSQLIDQENLPIAPKIFKPMCEVNWLTTCLIIHNLCRGLSPYPSAWTTIYDEEKKESKTLKLFKTEPTDLKSTNETKLLFQKDGLYIPCKDYYLKVLELQPEGKKRMNYKDFAAGYNKNSYHVNFSK